MEKNIGHKARQNRIFFLHYSCETCAMFPKQTLLKHTQRRILMEKLIFANNFFSTRRAFSIFSPIFSAISWTTLMDLSPSFCVCFSLLTHKHETNRFLSDFFFEFVCVIIFFLRTLRFFKWKWALSWQNEHSKSITNFSFRIFFSCILSISQTSEALRKLEIV